LTDCDPATFENIICERAHFPRSLARQASGCAVVTEGELSDSANYCFAEESCCSTNYYSVEDLCCSASCCSTQEPCYFASCWIEIREWFGPASRCPVERFLGRAASGFQDSAERGFPEPVELEIPAHLVPARLTLHRERFPWRVPRPMLRRVLPAPSHRQSGRAA